MGEQGHGGRQDVATRIGNQESEKRKVRSRLIDDEEAGHIREVDIKQRIYPKAEHAAANDPGMGHKEQDHQPKIDQYSPHAEIGEELGEAAPIGHFRRADGVGVQDRFQYGKAHLLRVLHQVEVGENAGDAPIPVVGNPVQICLEHVVELVDDVDVIDEKPVQVPAECEPGIDHSPAAALIDELGAEAAQQLGRNEEDRDHHQDEADLPPSDADASVHRQDHDQRDDHFDQRDTLRQQDGAREQADAQHGDDYFPGPLEADRNSNERPEEA